MVKLYYTDSANSTSKKGHIIGSFEDDDFGVMAKEAHTYVDGIGDAYDCDKIAYIEEALRLRGYYSFGYGSGRAYLEKV